MRIGWVLFGDSLSGICEYLLRWNVAWMEGSMLTEVFEECKHGVMGLKDIPGGMRPGVLNDLGELVVDASVIGALDGEFPLRVSKS
jgi:hypothetical protein